MSKLLLKNYSSIRIWSLTKKLKARMKSVIMMMIKRIMMMTPKRMQLSGE